MRLLALTLLLSAAVSAIPVAVPSPTDATVAKRDLLTAIPEIEFQDIDIPAWLEKNRLTLDDRVDTMLQRNGLSRRSSALGLFDAMGFKYRNFDPIMEYLQVRINADINLLFRKRGTWYDQSLSQMFEALDINVGTTN